MGTRKQQDRSGAVVAEPRAITRQPPMFNVLLHNDNFTTMEFVIEVLISVFHHDEPTAFRIMLQVHNEGLGVAGVYPFEIAESKAAKVMRLAREQEFPLLCSVEEA
ncbi:MAG: ATP-dependent Clp protease adaptor ClpS [Blastocatellia bacterium]|nr:ATP-dependent Clp protease adaptor ClpS [Blastocatellia bacterium]